jgi:hypothetical protein
MAESVAPNTRGGDFEAWFNRSETQSSLVGGWRAGRNPRTVDAQGHLKALVVDITSSIRIFELRLEA